MTNIEALKNFLYKLSRSWMDEPMKMPRRVDDLYTYLSDYGGPFPSVYHIVDCFIRAIIHINIPDVYPGAKPIFSSKDECDECLRHALDKPKESAQALTKVGKYILINEGPEAFRQLWSDNPDYHDGLANCIDALIYTRDVESIELVLDDSNLRMKYARKAWDAALDFYEPSVYELVKGLLTEVVDATVLRDMLDRKRYDHLRLYLPPWDENEDVMTKPFNVCNYLVLDFINTVKFEESDMKVTHISRKVLKNMTSRTLVHGEPLDGADPLDIGAFLNASRSSAMQTSFVKYPSVEDIQGTSVFFTEDFPP